LRAEGLPGEAERLEETEFAEATAKAREGTQSEFEAESFAEILVPMLAERLAANAGPIRAAAHVVKRERVGAPAAARDIADFIDDMLSQDRSA
jgi:hypothetical protein